jgi:gliding motility-associated-like protein
VNVTDSKGCTTDPQKVTVTVNQGLLAVATGPDTVCEGNAATVSAHCTGGDGGPYTFYWDFGATGEDVFVSPFTNTVYTVTVTDGCGSPAVTATVPVIVIPNPDVHFIPNPSNGCQPLLVNFSDQSNATGIEYYWNFGDGTSDTTRNPSHIFLDAGSYTVNHLVTSNTGCIGKIVVPAAVNVFPNPIASFSNIPEITSVYAPEISFFDASTNAVSWQWDFGDHSNPLFNRNPSHTYQDTGIYEVKLITTSPNGCIDTAFGKVVIRGEFAFYMPNAFTPNNDGVNDNFMALGIGVKEFEMFIYDRWGLQIFHSQDLKMGWDGRVQGKETPCQMDVYLYVVKVVDFMGRSHQYIGHVSLVR